MSLTDRVSAPQAVASPAANAAKLGTANVQDHEH